MFFDRPFFQKRSQGVGLAPRNGLSFLQSFFLWAFCLQRKKRLSNRNSDIWLSVQTAFHRVWKREEKPTGKDVFPHAGMGENLFSHQGEEKDEICRCGEKSPEPQPLPPTRRERKKDIHIPL